MEGPPRIRSPIVKWSALPLESIFRKILAKAYTGIFEDRHLSRQDPDASSSSARPFVALVRGTERFMGLIKNLENKNVELSVEEQGALPLDLRQGIPPGAYDGLFPGLLSR